MKILDTIILTMPISYYDITDHSHFIPSVEGMLESRRAYCKYQKLFRKRFDLDKNKYEQM